MKIRKPFIGKFLADGVLCVAMFSTFVTSGVAYSQEGNSVSSAIEPPGDMLRLFLNSEERRVLEAIRQGLLKDEQLDRIQEIATARIKEFEEQVVTEGIILDEFIDFDDPVVRERGRSQDLIFGGYIKIGDKNSTLLVNGQLVEAQDLYDSQGLDVNEVASEKGELVAIDLLRRERVKIKPGQTIPASTSQIRENLVVSNPGTIPTYASKLAKDSDFQSLLSSSTDNN